MEIIGGYYYGIKFESDWNWGAPIPERHGVSNITVKQCKIHDTGRDCFKIAPSCDNLLIESCEIYNSGIGPANPPGDPNAEGIDCVNSDNLTVRNCYIHNTSTTGVYSKGGSINSLIENNLVTNTGENGILLGFYTDQEWFDSIANPNYYENLNGTVRNNIVINTGNDGIGMYAAYQPKVYNNTVINAANSNMIGNCIVDYNVYYKSGGAEFDDGIDWQALTFDQWKTSTSFDENSFEDNPDLDGNYHLSNGSPCIDNAAFITGLEYDYDSSVRTEPFDIGADEYGAGDILEVPPLGDIIGTGNGIPLNIIEYNSQEYNTEFLCYPNPSDGEFNIELNMVKREFISVQLTDLTGKLIQTAFSGEVYKGKQILHLKTTQLETGIYTLTIKTSNESLSKNIILINRR